MTPKTYINFHREQVETIQMSKIILTEKIHQWGVLCGDPNTKRDYCIIVRPFHIKDDEEKYSLVCGWADYQMAKKAGIENIPCLIVDTNREKFMKYLRNIPDNITYTQTKLSTIKIPDNWTKRKPRNSKVNNCENFYHRYGRFGTLITLNSDGWIVDGYTRYLAAQRLGLDNLIVQMVIG